MRKPIPVAAPIFSEEEAKSLYEVIMSGWVTMGPKVEQFEKEFAEYTHSKNAIAMFNGTVTLHSALAALGIGPGDQVIVPTLTYITTANVVLYQGADLVLCECDPLTYNVRVEDIEKVMNPKVKAIITVDMNGLPVDYDQIGDYARSKGIPFISDSAESLGAIYKNIPIGSQADMNSFSFFGNKNITTGEGGMITTNDDDLAKELRILRNQGQTGRYNHTHLGYNYRMTEMQAAIGIIQLKNLEKRIKMKEKIVDTYNANFESNEKISLPYLPKFASRHAWYMYTLSLRSDVDRDTITDYLYQRKIETRTSFPPVHIQPYYRKKYEYQEEDYPLSIGAWKKLINIPICPDLSDDELNYIIDSIKDAVEKN